MREILSQWVRAGSLAAVRQSGCTPVPAGGRTVVLVYHDGTVSALDNRCPHMGFPLSRGSVDDGLLTCHWHHARFDLSSGGTLDPFADDVRKYPVRIDGDDVFVDVAPHGDTVTYWKRRLAEGMEQSLSLVIAKSVLALGAAGVPATAIVAQAGEHGLRYRGSGWGSGMTILTALANVLPQLAPDDRVLALIHGVVRVAQDCAGQTPSFETDPLPGAGVPASRMELWFRRAVDVRDGEGAEKTLQTVVGGGGADGASGTETALRLLYAAATDHYFVDGGHAIDFITKAGEYLSHAGDGQANIALGSLVEGLCSADRSEEEYRWRYPIDLHSLVAPAEQTLEALWPERGDGAVGNLDALAGALLGDSPEAAIAALLEELRGGASPVALAQAIAYAAALRLARFPISNEFGDWDTVHNTWSSCNALYRAIERIPTAELCRGLFHAAMALYLDRFLNVPAARLPEEQRSRGAPTSAEVLLDRLVAAFDRQQQVDEAAGIVHAYLEAGYADGRLLEKLGALTLREDAGFHMYQTLEAGIRLYRSLLAEHPVQARRVLIGVVRFQAAHSPTPRALNQTARIALRLHRGEDVYEESASSG